MARRRILASIICLTIFAIPTLSAQQTTWEQPVADTTDQTAQAYREFIAPTLHVMSQSYGDSVVLRWAPSNAPSWRAYNRIGYIVERALIDTNDTGPIVFERLTPAPIKPWTLEEWRQRTRPDQQFAAIAAQCLYGRLSIPKPNTVESILDAASELENRYGFALFAADCDAFAATGLGLRFVDRTVKVGQTWAYRIFPAYQDSLFSLDTVYHVVDVTPYKPWPPVLELSAEGSDRQITLRWKNFPMGGYTGFNVYRAGPDKRRQKLNVSPIVPATPRTWTKRVEPWFDDTTAQWNVEYTYEVRGITPFGEEGEPALITASLRDRTPPPMPVLKKPILYGLTMVRLEWEIKEVPDLAGFLVFKSDKPTSDWRPLHMQPLPREQRAFLDTLADPLFPHYVVVAIDTAGNRSDYLPLYVDIHDTLPPAPPTGVRGTIDTSGVVRLEWNLGTERDLLGYRVLWANDTTHEFSQRTNLVWEDTVFYDTVAINTLTEYVYYRVVAVDNRYFHSDPSPIVAIKRPDVVPPVAPIFTDVRSYEDRVVLTWNPSTSSDAVKQILYRRVENDTAWKVIAELANQTMQYTDTAVAPRTKYSYTLEAIDRSGLHSERALPVQGRPYGSALVKPLDRLQAVYDTTGGVVVMEWQYLQPPQEKYWYVIYRAVDHHPLQQYRAVDASERRFIDRELVGAGRYRYTVRVMTPVEQSPMSEEVEVIVP